MEDHPIHVITGNLTGDGPLDTAVSRAILARVSDGDLPEMIQVGLPHRVVAFGKHDTLTPGFRDAVGIARDQGFDPTIRIAGGRAVVFHPGTVRFSWTVPVRDPVAGMHERFRSVADRTVTVLTHFGVPSSIGELPDEYCPGDWSVHTNQDRKVMGSGQRLARHAAQIGGVLVVNDAQTINDVLLPIYRALGLTMDANRTGSIEDVSVVSPDAVAQRFQEALVGDRASLSTDLDAPTMDLAHTMKPDHAPTAFA